MNEEKPDMMLTITANNYSAESKEKLLRAIKADDAWSALGDIQRHIRNFHKYDAGGESENEGRVALIKVIECVLEDSGVRELWI